MGVNLIVLTDAGWPDPSAAHWRGYRGSRMASGTMRDCIARLFVPDEPCPIKVLTGDAAEEYLILHGDPAIKNPPRGILTS